MSDLLGNYSRNLLIYVGLLDFKLFIEEIVEPGLDLEMVGRKIFVDNTNGIERLFVSVTYTFNARCEYSLTVHIVVEKNAVLTIVRIKSKRGVGQILRVPRQTTRSVRYIK